MEQEVKNMADRLNPGEHLTAGGSITSHNSRFTFTLQGDGNLVLYRSDGKYRWDTATNGRMVSHASMQTDGNFVIFGKLPFMRLTGPIWATNTAGHPGAWLVVQDDGNVVIYDQGGSWLWDTNTNISRAVVDGFLPSTSGFHFANAFPSTPLLSLPSITVGNIQIGIGDASNGLCGGMVFAARDLFECGFAPPATTTPPVEGPLFDYLVCRLFDSFNLPLGVTKYLALMNPTLPDHETDFSRMGLAPRGRAWVMIREEWPKIKDDVDHNRLSPIGLVQTKSANPSDLGHHHVVLVYGYELDGSDLTLLVYDPNYSDADGATISLSIADPEHTTVVSRSKGGSPIFCFFRLDYGMVQPPAGIFG
jgi:hypothetical protein